MFKLVAILCIQGMKYYTVIHRDFYKQWNKDPEKWTNQYFDMKCLSRVLLLLLMWILLFSGFLMCNCETKRFLKSSQKRDISVAILICSDLLTWSAEIGGHWWFQFRFWPQPRGFHDPLSWAYVSNGWLNKQQEKVAKKLHEKMHGGKEIHKAFHLNGQAV